jgi:hypothetical protein
MNQPPPASASTKMTITTFFIMSCLHISYRRKPVFWSTS